MANSSIYAAFERFWQHVVANIGNKADADHNHNYAGSSSAGGAATSANKVNSALTVKLNSGTTEGTNMFTFDGSAEKSVNITPSAIGAAASSHGTHVSYSTTAPVMDGTASVGSASTVARSDHKHPTDTSRAAASDVTALQELVGDTSVAEQIDAAKDGCITGLSVSGQTVTYTKGDGSTGTIKTQDTNTTYSSLKNPNAMTVQGNGTTSFTYDGSAAKTLNIKAGSNVSVSSDTSGNITISSTDTNTTYSAATTSANGLMTAAMVTKLNGIATGANAYSLPAATSSVLGGVKTGSNITNSSGTISLTKANVTSALGYTPPTTNTTYSAATTSAAGLMSASDKSKLDGITASADTVSFSRSLSSGTKIGTITINGTGTDLYCQTNTDTDTHYTTRIYAGASGTAANASATSPYIKITDDNTCRNQIRLIGSGATTVTSDANGNITINSTDTNTNTNTTYKLSKSGTTITLTGSDGSTTSVTDSDTNTTYSKLSQFTNDSGYITGITKAMVTNALGYTPPTSDTNTDTKVTQAYSTSNANYPLLLTATSGVSSTSSRGDTTSILSNKLYANPSTGYLYSSGQIQAGGSFYTNGFVQSVGNMVCGGNMTVQGTVSFGSDSSIISITTVGQRIQPASDNGVNCGYSDARWMNVYCAKSANTTSDKNQKRDIKDIDDRYIALFDLVQPSSYYLIDGDRVHTGFIAQDVEDAMEQVGLTAEELGFFCKDIKHEIIYDENGHYLDEKEVLDENGSPVYTYGLRYEEYIAIMAEKIKRLEAQYNSKLEELEKRLEALEA